MSRPRRSSARAVAIALGIALCGGAVADTSPASAAAPASASTAARAIAFIASQQRADGGFGAAEEGFAGFETPDAVLALADAAQRTLVYDAATALAAVRAVRRGGNDGLHYLDDLADGGIDVGKAAQLVVVARAVALDPTKFDPDRDGAADLVAIVDGGRQPDGSYGSFFNSTVQAIVAFAAIGRTVPADTIAVVKAAQQASGGYDFTGDPSSDAEDIDTTGRVVQALVAAGVPASEPSIAKAMAFLAAEQGDDGSWSAFGSPDPNSTAQAVLAIESAGFAAEDDCWRVANGAPPRSVTPDEFLRKAQAADGHIASGGDAFGVNTFATSQAVQALIRTLQPLRRATRQACPTTGYRLVAADGGVFAHGDRAFLGSTGSVALNRPMVATASTPTGRGQWLFASDGGVFAFGDAGFFGSTGDLTLNQPIVGAAATPSGGGYWLFARDGGVFAFGDAAFLGSMGGVVLNRPVVAGMTSPTGRGYLLVASDGGVFTFGDATFEGSTASLTLNRPVVSAAPSRSGRGYLLFASDGGVFAFGDAPFAGSTGGLTLNAPIVGGFRSEGDGYYLVASDGGVFALAAPFLGSEGASALNAPVVGGGI